jgi:cyclopropane fatty-acyl-phospholipid synthase-like methyltransferase
MDLTRLLFGIMYRVGFTPWDGHALPTRLRELVEGAGALAKGRALDVGCGTGDTSIYLAQHGWDVTGIDFVQRAIDRAKVKADAAGARVRLLRADVTRLREFSVGDGFTLVVDNGCFHGLGDEQRDGYVRELTALTTPGARLLLVGFLPGKRRPGPRGVDRAEIERHFAAGWELVQTGEAGFGAPRTGEQLHFYELRHR